MHYAPTTLHQLGAAVPERLLRETIAEFRARGFLDVLKAIVTDELKDEVFSGQPI